jgi:hypothetical protein
MVWIPRPKARLAPTSHLFMMRRQGESDSSEFTRQAIQPAEKCWSGYLSEYEDAIAIVMLRLFNRLRREPVGYKVGQR